MRHPPTVARGEVDGVFTSPGGWSTQVIESAPHAVQVRGLMYINYALVANKAWLESLPADDRGARRRYLRLHQCHNVVDH